APGEGVTVRLVCRRRDGGARFRSREALVPGASQIELALPEAQYDIEVEPIGELLVHPDTRVLQVARSATVARVSLAANPARIDVQLGGLSADELPVRVYPQP